MITVGERGRIQKSNITEMWEVLDRKYSNISGVPVFSLSLPLLYLNHQG